MTSPSLKTKATLLAVTSFLIRFLWNDFISSNCEKTLLIEIKKTNKNDNFFIKIDLLFELSFCL